MYIMLDYVCIHSVIKLHLFKSNFLFFVGSMKHLILIITLTKMVFVSMFLHPDYSWRTVLLRPCLRFLNLDKSKNDLT